MAVWLGEIIVSSAFIVLSIIFYIMAGEFAGGSTNNPLDVGPAAFPRLMLVLIALFSVIQIVLSLKKRRKLINENKEAKKIVISNRLAMLCTCVLMLIYGFVMPIIGFYITTPVFICLVMLLMGNRKWRQLVFVPLGFALFVYATFSLLLRVSLP